MAKDDAPTKRVTPQYYTSLRRAPHDAPVQDGTTDPYSKSPQIEDFPFMYALQYKPHVLS